MAKRRSTWDTVKGWLVHPEAKRIRHFDMLENSYLGYGTARDKLSFGVFVPGCRLTHVELDAMYYADDVCARIVNARPTEMFRRGYHLRSKKNPEGASALQERAKALKVDAKVKLAMQWGRLRGGALLVIGATDSPDQTQPLNVASTRDVRFLNVVDSRYAIVAEYQDDPTLPDYGEPRIYTIGNPAGPAPVQRVHASRVIRFEGVSETDPITRRQLGGWTYSVLQRPYDVVRKFATAFDSTAQLMADASQGVWKIQGLLDAIANDRDALTTRLAINDMTRSAGRAVMLDADGEDFTRVATTFAGVDAVLDRFMMRLAAASEMPATLLMGRSPAGQNATGDSDFRAWYGTIGTEQVNELKPALLRVYEIIGKGQIDDLDIEFCPLWEPTEEEKATTYYTNAQGDNLYYQMGSLLSGQIAIARFGSGEGRFEIDEESLKADIENETELMLNPPPPPPVTAGPNPNDPAAETTANAPPPYGQAAKQTSE